METVIHYLCVFITGGVFCAIAQILIDKTRITPARILVFYVVSGVILHAFGIYEKIVEFGSMGAKIPLTGFGYCLADGVKMAVEEKGLFGALTGGFSGAACGISAAVVFALAVSIVFKSKDT